MNHEIKLGQLVEPGHERDAIHIAVIPATAGETLKPGQHVGPVPETETIKTSELYLHIGIVDPFLKQKVLSGQQHWLFLYPDTITDMRHHWSHPSFPPSTSTGKKGMHIQQIADRIGKTYEQLLADMTEFATNKYYISNGDDERYSEISSELWEKAWAEFSTITGIEEDRTWAPYRCSC
jgi:hypothetical protein